MKSADRIRDEFIEFFKGKGHTFVPSSPVVPLDDPTLMFANAGMNQFKDVFLGLGTRPYKRAADTQKCIRAGGKHNDLDDVGHDTYHHTFFEMLGNWSFGDYFKKEAISWAWELLTGVWGIDKRRLHATYFEGDEKEGLEPDAEARELWASITDIDPTHIHPGNKKDNFWEMGDTGPCGPCSEIHIDLTPDMSGGGLVNAGDCRVMEIWNLVFIQYNRGSDGTLSPLPARHVDTGMGFERICAVLRGMETGRLGQVSNYDTDVFAPIFAGIHRVTGAAAYTGRLANEPRALARAVSRAEETLHASESPRGLKPAARLSTADQVMVDIAYRVIADHVRCLTFALTDGAVPSNEGRGYVLRRILRRAVRYGRQYLGVHEPFLCKLVPVVVEAMGHAFPELKDKPERVADLVRDEEESFIKTLDRGIALFEEAAERSRQAASTSISGEDAFKLHDTYGFPVDLTEVMARERGMTVDTAEYERLMEAARERARGAAGKTMSSQLAAWHFDSVGWKTAFVGYETRRCETKLIHIVVTGRPGDLGGYLPETSAVDPFVASQSRGVFGGPIYEGESGFLVLEKTPFYAEKGGQIGDRGWITTSTGRFEVQETKEIQGRIVQYGVCVSGFLVRFDPTQTEMRGTYSGRGLSSLTEEQWSLIPYDVRSRAEAAADHLNRQGGAYSELAVAEVDVARVPTMHNHTATHILNWSLREVLELGGGGKVDQKGSLVDPEKTRFDFSHNKALTAEELERIEALCNEQIKADRPVYTKEVAERDARRINSLRAVFGEKYPEMVRVVSVGADIDAMLADPQNPEWMKHPVEFCGGTHVRRTGEIGAFVLTAEEAVAKGIRRVVGITGERAAQVIEAGKRLLDQAAAIKAGPADQIAAGLADLQKQVGECEIPVRDRIALRGLIAELQQLVKQQSKQQAAQTAGALSGVRQEMLEKAERVNGTALVVGELPEAPVEQVREAADWLRTQAGSAAVCLAVTLDGKPMLVAAMTEDLVKKGLKAGELIRHVVPAIDGRGGGKPDLAQAGGKKAEGIADALAAAAEWIRERLR